MLFIDNKDSVFCIFNQQKDSCSYMKMGETIEL